MPPRCARTACSPGRSPPGPGAESGEEVGGEDRGNVGARDFLQPRPRRHAVDLEHGRTSVRIVHDVDPGKIRSDRGRGGESERLHLRIDNGSHRAPAALDVGDPARRAAHHRGDDAAVGHQQAKITKAVALDADVTLQIIDALQVPGSGKSCSQRISCKPRPCEPNSGFSTSGPAPISRRTIAAAASGDSTAQVAGVAIPIRASRKLVVDLSTQRSMARASLTTGTPFSRNACRIPSRKVTASKLPPATDATMTTLSLRPPNPPLFSPDALSLSHPQAASSTQTARAPKPVSALPSSRACQSWRSVISAIDSEEVPPSAASASPEFGIEPAQPA